MKISQDSRRSGRSKRRRLRRVVSPAVGLLVTSFAAGAAADTTGETEPASSPEVDLAEANRAEANRAEVEAANVHAPSAQAASVQATGARKSTSTVHLGARLFGQNSGSGLELDGRYGFRSGVQLGVLGSAGYAQHSYISGQPVDDVVLTRGALVLLVPTMSEGRAQLFLRFVHGVAVLMPQTASAVRQTNEVAAFAHLALGARSLLRAGVVLGADLEVSPTVELADQYQGLEAGYGYAISRQALVYGAGAVGSTFGFNGDNGKVYYGGSLGMRLTFGKEDARGAF